MLPTDFSSTSDVMNSFGSIIVAYSDDASPAIQLSSGNLGLLAVVAVGTGALFTVLGKSLKSSPQGFSLSEEETSAMAATMDVFDPLPADRAITEAGLVGTVRRKELSKTAISNYQSSKNTKEARGKTLTYAEVDLGFLATLLRFVQPSAGETFVDIG
jgi:hypothetical protein